MGSFASATECFLEKKRMRLECFSNSREVLFTVVVFLINNQDSINNIAQLFSNEGINISSFLFKECEDTRFAKVDIALHSSYDQVESAVNDLESLVDVYKVSTFVNEGDVNVI